MLNNVNNLKWEIFVGTFSLFFVSVVVYLNEDNKMLRLFLFSALNLFLNNKHKQMQQ